MTNPMCPTITPAIKKLASDISKAYPEASVRDSFNEIKCSEWVGIYNADNNKPIDFTPDYKSLVSHIERKRNMEGKSFLYVPESITYSLPGQSKQTYTVINTKIFNKHGKEVFSEAGKHRNRIFANLAVQQGRAVVVKYKEKEYVVNNKNQIMSVATADIMQWGEENGDRKAILALSKAAFEAKQKTATTTTNTEAAIEGVKDREQLLKDTKSKLAKVVRTGRGGHISLYELPKSYNGYPVLYLNIYNSGDDTEFDYQYRINNAGNIEVRSKWASEDWKDNWEEKNTIHEPIKEFFNALKLQNNTINQENSRYNNKPIEYGNDFRRIQETVRRSSKEGQQSVSGRDISLNRRQDLANVLRRELGSIDSFAHGSTRALNNQKHRTSFVLHTEVDPQLFHDIFEVVRFYTDNGELVDLHDDYTGCKCYLTEDGTAGFAIEPNGNLVSVFNLGTTKGFLSAAKDVILESGATHLDAFASNNQNLRLMYEKLLGAKVASSMDYNMEFDHDDIAKNHGNPQVVFMVIGEAANEEVKEKHFDKDSYYEAVKYQQSFLNTQPSQNNPVLEQFKANIETLSPYFEGGGSNIYSIIPGLPEELGVKLADYFLGNGEISLDDYRNLWKWIEFVPNNNPATKNALPFVPRKKRQDVQQPVQQAVQSDNTQGSASVEDTPKPQRPKSAAYESALQTNDSRIAQFNRTFSPQQIKDRGAMISDIFSRIIDDLVWDEIDAQTDIIESSEATEAQKDEARLRVKALRDPLKGRQLAVQDKIGDVIEEVKEQIITDMEYAEDDKKPLYQNTLDFFEDLFNAQASLDIEEREGIRIIGLKIKEQTAEEDTKDEIDDGDDEVGHIVSGNDGWLFQVRFEDPFNSLSKKVRSMLYEIERPESEVDDLGNHKYYPMGQIYASFLSYLSKHMQSPDDFIQIYHNFNDVPEDVSSHMYADNEEEFSQNYPNGYPVFPVLEELRKTYYPWVQQVIQRLTDDYTSPDLNTSLRYPSTGGSLASQFYTNFRKAYIPYGKVQLGTNKFGITPLNYQMDERVQRDKLEANYNNRMLLTDKSIYDAQGRVNKANAKWLNDKIKEVIDDVKDGYYKDFPEMIALWEQDHDAVSGFGENDIENYNNFIDSIRYILQSYGIDATRDTVTAFMMADEGKPLHNMLSRLEYINQLIEKLDDDKIESFNYMLDLRNQYGENPWVHFFDGAGMITDATYMQSFYDSASHKTKYSYSADNYLMKTFRGVAMGTLEQRRAFIEEHFGKYEWFRNQKTYEWKNKWLEYWYNYPFESTEIPYRNIDNISDYDGIDVRVRQYVKWTPDDIWQVQSRSYDPEKKSYDNIPAYYLAPIFSDSPMSMTVMGPRMSMEELLYGHLDDNGIRHQGAFVQLVNQELYRIQLVQERQNLIKQGVIKEIANFDKRGTKFCFIPELNDYQCEADEANGYPQESFLNRMMRLKSQKNVTLKAIEETQIKAIRDIMTAKMHDYMLKNNLHYEHEPISEEQFYNMTYANTAIIQLTTVDLAFYKNNVDFQKRFKEVYAGGIQLNTNSKYGRKTENVILLADDVITSPNYTDIAAIIDGSNILTKEEKEAIKDVFTKVNVADAQAIRSMHSFRSILDMMGKWTDEMEQALNRFKDGTWSREDFEVIFQTIKPFVYTVIERNSGNGSPMLVPQQHKNSEICALMMYSLINNGLSNSPVYRALSRFMDETTDANGEHLIDMAQFESAGKVGNQGVINISFNPNKVMAIIERGIVVGGEEFEFSTAYKNGKYLENTLENVEENYKAIKKDLDKELAEGKTTQEEYNKIMAYLRPTEDEIIDMLSQAVLVTNPDGSKGINTEVVHTIPFDNYYQQQPTPEHHIDAEATYGSQERNIAVADLPDDFVLTLKGKKGSKSFKGRDAIIDFYYELLNENLLEDFFGKGKKKGLKGIFASKKDLRDAVTEIVRGNPKYGKDFADALQLDENGEFVLSPNSPTIFNMMQEIITSFFKNRITKQTINGAALIQAAGIGLDNDLRIKYDDDGKLLGAECYMPLTTRRFFEPLLETKTIDGKEVKVLSPEKLKKAGLDKAIGYRIPTENKSSMMPLIIKGFTPLQNGSAIVLPAEITAMAGSDFDVDKMFIMLLSFYIQNYDMRKARETWANQQSVIRNLSDIFYKSDLLDELSEEDPEDFKTWFEEHKEEFKLATPRIHRIEYDFSKTPKENGRKARNNMLIQMTFNILTSKEGSQSLFNPQGFPDVERAAKITRILTSPELQRQLIDNQVESPAVVPNTDTIRAQFLDDIRQNSALNYEAIKDALMKMSDEEVLLAYQKAVITETTLDDIMELLLNASTDELNDFINTYNPLVSPIYPQAFADSHAKNMAGSNQIGIYAIQASMCAKYQRADVRLKEEQQFTINGRKIVNVDVSDGGRRLKNNGQMVGASADNGKNPNLTDMGSTSKTAPMIGYMLRAGLSHLEAALIINQECMQKANFSSKSEYWKASLGKAPLAVPAENVTTKLLMKSLFSPLDMTQEEQTSIDALCYRILTQCEAQEYLTQVSRADSPNGAMQNTYAKSRVQQYKVDLLQAKMGQKEFPFVRIKEALSNDAIDTSAPEEVVREQLKGQRMGFLHGMYALGINSFQNLMSPYFFGARKSFDENIVKPILYNLNEKMSDEDKEKIVNNIYTSYITYVLSGSSLFGSEEDSTMKEKREYYLQTFPDDYIKIIQENEDIRDLLSSILQVTHYNGVKRISLKDVGSLSKGQKRDIQLRFESLCYSDNPAAQKLATDLLLYSYFDNGLQFTHDSFSHLFTTTFLNNFPVYNQTLLQLNNDLSPEDNINFIHQFLLTFPSAAFKADGIIKDENKLDEATLMFDFNTKEGYSLRSRLTNEVMSPNPLSEGYRVYPYISFKGDVYVLNQDFFDADPSKAVYIKLPKYGTYPGKPLFSRQMTLSQLAHDFPYNENTQQQLQEMADVDMSYNEVNEDPAIGTNKWEAAAAEMDDFEVPDFDPDPAPMQSDSDKYQNEGQGELKEQLCRFKKNNVNN